MGQVSNLAELNFKIGIVQIRGQQALKFLDEVNALHRLHGEDHNTCKGP
jgi:hypothetical protein